MDGKKYNIFIEKEKEIIKESSLSDLVSEMYVKGEKIQLQSQKNGKEKPSCIFFIHRKIVEISQKLR